MDTVSTLDYTVAMRITWAYTSAFLLLLGTACDSGDDAAANPGAGECAGAKCDAYDEDPAEQTCLQTGGSWTDDASDAYYCLCPDYSEPEDGNCQAEAVCLSDDELIEVAREYAMDEEDYTLEDFIDGATYIETIDDLDGDGVPETVVYPGRPFAGANALMVLFLTDGRDCATAYGGTFGGVGITTPVLGGSNNGISDIVVGNGSSACQVAETQYRWNGNTYEEFSIGYSDFCECDYDALVRLAQEESREFDAEDFQGTTSYEVVADLDGDQVSDLLVFPGMSFAGSSVMIDILLSQGQPCPTTLALETSGDQVLMAEDRARSGGVLDLEAYAHDQCDGYITRYAFSDRGYTEAETRTLEICEDE